MGLTQDVVSGDQADVNLPRGPFSRPPQPQCWAQLSPPPIRACHEALEWNADEVVEDEVKEVVEKEVVDYQSFDFIPGLNVKHNYPTSSLSLSWSFSSNSR